MFDFILFVLFAAWIIYDIIQTYHASQAGKPVPYVALRFFLAAPVDLVKWAVSKF